MKIWKKWEFIPANASKEAEIKETPIETTCEEDKKIDEIITSSDIEYKSFVFRIYSAQRPVSDKIFRWIRFICRDFDFRDPFQCKKEFDSYEEARSRVVNFIYEKLN